MNSLKIPLVLSIALFSYSALGSTLIWDVMSCGASEPKDDENGKSYYEFSYGCSIEGDGFRAYAWVISTFTFSGVNVVVSPFAMDVGSGKYFAKVEQGDVVDAESVRDENSLFATNWEYDGNNIVVRRNGSFMLGFEIDNDLIYDPVTGEFDKLYGWAIFQFNGTSVSVTSSALAIGTDGIYAGTGIIIPRQIPEPSAVALLALGIVALALRRGQRAA